MSQPQLEIQAIAVVVAVACALPGVFLVLRRVALLSDAISHSILLGIVLAFFVAGTVTSPLLIVGAAAMGLITVVLVQALTGTRLVSNDAAIGLVFPALFSVAVVLIARYSGDVHLDTDVVLLGELAFAPFERLVIAGYDMGPQALYLMGGILLLNLGGLLLFYKELKLSTFDAALAAALGFSPAVIHLGLMGMVSVTAVGAFDAVGSILVVALMIAPPTTAYLLTDRLPRMIVASAGIGATAAIGGYWVAHFLDASIAGSIASALGLMFALAFALAPQRGLVAVARRRARQRWEFARTMLAIHLLNHESLPEAADENRVEHLKDGLGWDGEFTEEVVKQAKRSGLLSEREGALVLSDSGRRLAQRAIAV